MKRICFPATARPHMARQKLLIEELKKYFIVDIFEPKTSREGGMSVFSIFCAIEFHNFLLQKKYDAIIIRGDRFEMLGLAMVGVYHGIPLVHIEGGDVSGVIDNKIRHAITQLSDFHFSTNEESQTRIIQMGVSPNKVWDFGSLDVEFALSVQNKKPRENPYILVVYHPIPNENQKELENALLKFSEHDIRKIVSNSDYGNTYGEETYSPEEFINLIRYASCCVGNSSAFLKEASILGTPVVNIGERQNKRIKPSNVINVPCKKEDIESAIEFQLKRQVKPDTTYYKPDTSKRIAEILFKNI